VVECQFAPASELLATAAWDGTVRLWDAAQGEVLVTTTDPFLGFASDGRQAAFLDGPTLRIRDLACSQELRTLNPAGIGNQIETPAKDSVRAARFHPDGRMVALISGGDVYLDDASDLRELAHLKVGACDTVLFDADGRNLITSGHWGLFRWPIRPDPDGRAGTLRVGPPELLQELAGEDEWRRASWLQDHHTLALIDNLGARVLMVDTNRPVASQIRERALSSDSNRSMTSIAINPDGRWAAAGGWKTRGIYVWDLPRHRLERILPPGPGEGDSQTSVAFSPDGGWLVSCTHNSLAPGYYFWEVGTWKRGPLISKLNTTGFSVPVYSADGRLVALTVSFQQIRLAETANLRTLAHLTTLQPVSASPLAFSPDGSRLIASTNLNTALMWDLRRIREQLGTMDLDWDQPSFPPEGGTPATTRPSIRSIRVVGEVLEPSARRAAELAGLNQRLQNHPDDGDALIGRGRNQLRALRWSDAIADLEQGRRLRPDDSEAYLLLAEAHLQTDSLSGARAALDRHLARWPDDLDARLGRGLVALRLGQAQVAADDLTRVLAADPHHLLARERRTRAWLALARYQEALADLDELIRSQPDSTRFVELRSGIHERLGHHQAAQADRERVAGSRRPTANELNNEAWAMATGAVYFRDPERAVELARMAVAREPSEATFLNTLGVALYRAGWYAEATATLEQSLAANQGRFEAFDLFYLAMAQHRLGQKVQARESFDRAVRWWRQQKQLVDSYAKELAAFRAEAEAVLAGPAGELADNVFAGPN
jgi:tetratricopeptide (TPR) repeat protein/WD40 repeat protein